MTLRSFSSCLHFFVLISPTAVVDEPLEGFQYWVAPMSRTTKDTELLPVHEGGYDFRPREPRPTSEGMGPDHDAG